MFQWIEAIRELYPINQRRLAAGDEQKSLQPQSPDFNEPHPALKEALSRRQQCRDELLRKAQLSAPQKAVLSSLKTHWPGLTLLVDHPQVCRDNNESERGVRNGVNARHNDYGSGSQWSAPLTAAMLTVLQTILRLGINPRHGMIALLTACAENGSKPPTDLSPFLPWTMDGERKPFLSRAIPEDQLHR